MWFTNLKKFQRNFFKKKFSLYKDITIAKMYTRLYFLFTIFHIPVKIRRFITQEKYSNLSTTDSVCLVTVRVL